MKLTLGMSLEASRSGAFSPLRGFANGESGLWLSPSVASAFTDTGGTTPVTAGTDAARVNDLSGNGWHVTQGTAAARPTFQQADGYDYLDFDGADDVMATALTDFPMYSMAISFRFFTGAAYAGIVTAPDWATDTGASLALGMDNTPGTSLFLGQSANFNLFAGATSFVVNGVAQSAAPITLVDNTDYIIIGDARNYGGNAYLNDGLQIGRDRPSGARHATIRLYDLVTSDAVWSDDYRAQLQTYLSTRNPGVDL